MSTATRVPETARMPGEELDASDARTALRRFGRRRLAVESFRRFRYADGFSHARAVGLQLVLALIPMTIALVGLSTVVHAEKAGSVIRDALLAMTPGSSDQLVRETLEQGLSQGDSGSVALWLGLATSLVALTTTMGQLERGSNRIYGIRRDRPTHAKYGRGVLLALAAGVPMMVGFLILVGGEPALGALSRAYGWPEALASLATALRWPVGLLLDLVAITVIFRWAPRRHQPAASWMAVGSAVALTLWLLLTWLLALFVRSSGSFGSVYGPLTAIMALLLWALLSGVALLLGIAFAAQLEAVRAGVDRGAEDDPERVAGLAMKGSAPPRAGENPQVAGRIPTS
jgi:YihY family inner membrane protein